MTKKINLLNTLILRLPLSLTMNSIFVFVINILFQEMMLDLYFILALLFTCLIFAGELTTKRTAKITAQSAICLVFMLYFFIMHLNMIGALFVIVLFYFVYCTSVDSSEDRSVSINKWIYFLAVASVSLFRTSQLSMFRLFIFSLVISVVCHHLGKLTCNMDSYIHSYKCRVYSKSFLRSINSNSVKLLLFYLSLVIAFSVPLFVQKMDNQYAGDVVQEIPQAVVTQPVITERQETEVTATVYVDVVTTGAQRSHEKDVDYKATNYNVVTLRRVVIVIVITIIIIASVMLSKRSKKRIDVESQSDEILEVSDCIAAKKRTAKRRFISSYNQAVRRIFMRKVSEYKKRGLVVKKSSTARALLEEISSFETVEPLDEAYHKARYSDVKMTKDDVLKLKRVSR